MAKAAQADMFAGMKEDRGPPPPSLIAAQEMWNEFAEKNKWKKCVVLDKARRAAMERALDDYGGMLGWKQALLKVERNRFVMGKVPPREGSKFKQFQANIDWFCRAQTIRQVFEDHYEDDGGQDGIEPKGDFRRRLNAASFDWDKKLAAYKPGGFWHVDTMGPRPEDKGPHKIPEDKLKAWREKHRIGERREETLEERLAASIATYRRLGDWARANAAEEKLATLQKRPPELIAAPDARDPDVVPERPKPPPYRAPAPRSEAEVTRQMAARQNATDVDYSWATDREGEYEEP